MAKNYIQPGRVITFTAGATTTSGSGVLIGLRLGVALTDVANGAQGEAQVEGVFSLAKLNTDVMAQGALLYWDNTNKRLTTTTAGNTLAGYAWEAAGNGDTVVSIKINA